MSDTGTKAAQPSRGVIHVAYGASYVAEAIVSARSVRATNPGLRLALISDQNPPEADVWDEITLLPNHKEGGSSAKIEMHRAPWDECMFLDTDTLVIGDLSPAFAVLNHFDFAGVQHSGGHHYQIEGLPSSFPEFNSGMLVWRRSEKAAAFFARWGELYQKYWTPHVRTFDQKSLRQALYESDLRSAALPHNYNVMPYFPSMLEGEAVVLHGRNHINLLRMQSRIGWSRELRAVVPGIGAILHPQEMAWRRICFIVFRLIALKIRCSFKRRS